MMAIILTWSAGTYFYKDRSSLITKKSVWRQLAPYLVSVAVILAFIVVEWAGSTNFGCAPAPSTVNIPAAISETPVQQNHKGGVSLSSLPGEAADTLKLIKQGGPFPYSKDGAVFSNYEGLLPAKSSGYYHEYTVITSGSPDRGARRIVAGSPGEYYYTGDHYLSFRRILE
jgi:ribonuclease T1